MSRSLIVFLLLIAQGTLTYLYTDNWKEKQFQARISLHSVQCECAIDLMKEPK